MFLLLYLRYNVSCPTFEFPPATVAISMTQTRLVNCSIYLYVFTGHHTHSSLFIQNQGEIAILTIHYIQSNNNSPSTLYNESGHFISYVKKPNSVKCLDVHFIEIKLVDCRQKGQIGCNLN